MNNLQSNPYKNVGLISIMFVTSYDGMKAVALISISHFDLCTFITGREIFKCLITNFNWHLGKKS